jgi:ferritin-like protein
MKDPTDIGMNRTGIATAPLLTAEMVAGARAVVPSGTVADWMADSQHMSYIADAEPVGTMPPPASLRGAAKAALKAIQGEKATVLLDKLGERLAFERSGSRLYEAFLRKLEVLGAQDGGPSLAEVREQYEEEKRHFALVGRAIVSLGGDPTVMTPCADVTSVASSGMLAVVADPRTDVLQCLDILLNAELIDNAGWELLIQLAEGLGQGDMADEFRVALENEARHLSNVREWVGRMTAIRAGAQPVPART